MNLDSESKEETTCVLTTIIKLSRPTQRILNMNDLQQSTTQLNDFIWKKAQAASEAVAHLLATHCI
jgi:hypothetical protein